MTMTAALAALVAFSASVQATPIVGSIGFDGGFSQTGGTAGDLSSANTFNILSPYVDTSLILTSGGFVGATLNSFKTPIDVSVGGYTALTGLQLWSVYVASSSTTYTFSVGSVARLANATTLTLSGSGTLMDGNTADNTAGAYTMTFSTSGNSFNFGSTAANNVPDGGATVMLLGAALSAMGLLRKKLIA